MDVSRVFVLQPRSSKLFYNRTQSYDYHHPLIVKAWKQLFPILNNKHAEHQNQYGRTTRNKATG